MNGRTTIDGADSLSRSAEDAASLASAIPCSVCGAGDGKDDDSSHHAAETDSDARTITAAANRRFCAPHPPLDAVPFSTNAAPAPRAACNTAASDDPPGSAGGSSVGTTFAASAPGDAFSTAIAVG